MANRTPSVKKATSPQKMSNPTPKVASVYTANAITKSSNQSNVRAVGKSWTNTGGMITTNTSTSNPNLDTFSGSGITISSQGSSHNLKISQDASLNRPLNAQMKAHAIEVNKGDTIQNITNEGTLTSQTANAYLSGATVYIGGKVENFTNKNKITNLFKSDELSGSAIQVHGTLTNFTNDVNGLIQGAYGITNTANFGRGTITNITNNGVIDTLYGGIYIDSSSIQGATPGKTQNITVGATGTIITRKPGADAAITIEGDVGTVEIQGTVVSPEGSGGAVLIRPSIGTHQTSTMGNVENITIGDNAIVGVIKDPNKTTNNITGADLDLNKGGIVNQGIVGNITNSSTNGIKVENISSSVNGVSGGVIQGGISNTGSGQLILDSSGIIQGNGGNHIENSGSGNIKIENILIGTDNPHKIGGSNTDNIAFDKITLDTQGKPLPGNIKDILTGSFDLNQIKTIVTDTGDIFNLTMDANGNFTTSLDLDNLNATSGAKSIITGNQRISSFANNVATTSLMNLQNAFNHSTTFYDASLRNQVHYANATGALGTDIINQSPNLDSLYFKDYIVYVLPYISSQEVEVGNGTKKISGNVQGIIAGYSKITPFNNLYSFYVGFEGEDTDSQGGSLNTNVLSKTLYGGFKMLHYLTNLSEKAELYAQYDASFGLRNNRLKSDSIGTTSSADPRSYFYNAGVDLGVNYLWGKNIITPKIGLGYEGGMIESYNLNIANTKIDRQDLNFLHTRASVLWSRAWNPKLHTYIEGGLKYIFNPDLDLTGSYAVGNNRQKASKEMDLDELNEFINIGIYVPLSNVLTFDVVYSGNFSDNYTGHIGYLKFNYLF